MREPCPAKCFHGHAGYDGRLRPVACKECGGTGWKPEPKRDG